MSSSFSFEKLLSFFMFYFPRRDYSNPSLRLYLHLYEPNL
nr:MAG TPA: hypothetical protein [Caudoviricetes sp.]